MDKQAQTPGQHPSRGDLRNRVVWPVVISAAITTRSMTEMALKKGDKVKIGMKSTAVFVEKD